MISAVAVMASFASCNKIEQENTPAADGTTTLTVSATVPQTKTNLSNGIVRWSANDVIAVLAEGYESVMSSLVPSACETHDFTVEGWYEVPDAIAVATSPLIGKISRLYFCLLLCAGGIIGMSFVNSVFVDAMAEDNNDNVIEQLNRIEKKLEELEKEIKNQ